MQAKNCTVQTKKIFVIFVKYECIIIVAYLPASACLTEDCSTSVTATEEPPHTANSGSSKHLKTIIVCNYNY